MKLMMAVILLIASPVFAHIQQGEHQGKTDAGETCSLIAGAQSFVNNQAHPLNERIEIKINGETFTVGHPPVVDAAKTVAYFNHDQFQGVLATNTGAKAVIIEMAHTATKEGPESFTLITHNWKTDDATKIVCKGLNFVK